MQLSTNFRAGQIERRVGNDMPSLRRFFEAVLPGFKAAEMDPATRNTLRRNTASIMIFFILLTNLHTI